MSDRRSSRASSSTGSSSSFSPTISGFYGADAETAKDVVMLVNDVRQVGGESVYKPFIRLLKDCAARRITRKKLIIHVHDLLKDHPFLLNRFCKLVPPSEVEEQPIHTVSEHAELEGRTRTLSRDDQAPPRRHRRATISRAHEHVVTFDLEGLNSKKAASVDMEVGLKRAQDKPPSSWVKRWPRRCSADSGATWARPWSMAQHWLRSQRVSDEPAAAQATT